VAADYEVPFLAHVPMEPLNCVADVRADRCEIWVSTQSPGGVRGLVSQVTGVAADRVTVHMMRSGGGFGRRLEADYAGEAAYISKAVSAPVQVVWTREDDIHHDFYRPAGAHRLRATLSSDGSVAAWSHHAATSSRYGYAMRPAVGSEVYRDDFPAGFIPNYRMAYSYVDAAVARGAWRSTIHSGNAFAVQSFIDELAHAAGRDAVEFRLAMIGRRDDMAYADHGGPKFSPDRLRNVLEMVAARSRWRTRLATGRARGVACHFTFGGYAAHVVEISRAGNGIRLERVTSVIDCGTVVNLSGAEAQAQGGILDGLSAALYGEVELRDGLPVQGNFDRYRLLRMREAPAIDVQFVRSPEAPGGLGEIAVPPSAPALANAIFGLTGRRLRRLPLARELAGT
jgi:isoquinoline 1-oxidoreductase beta subunit